VDHHTIGKLVKHKAADGVGRDCRLAPLMGIVVSERLKDVQDENGVGGCFVPQVLVEWIGEGQQQWLARKHLTWCHESLNGEAYFT
jgi:hypothetical protein